jgi:hypothetical protein
LGRRKRRLIGQEEVEKRMARGVRMEDGRNQENRQFFLPSFAPVFYYI